MITKEQALSESLKYFNNDELAATTWINKYALKDKNGDLLESNPSQMHRRLAREFARIESKYQNPMSEDEIFGLLDGFKYVVPQGRPMAGIGNENQKVSISNCFASGYVEDNYQSIMRHDSYIANIGKRGGGMGVNISKLRPSGSTTSNSAKGIVGATQFMDRFSYTTGEVTQGNRRGALMVVMEVNHPDIRMFITKKLDKVSVTNANISVAITDGFMKAVKNNEKYPLTFDDKVYENVLAKDIYDLIVKSAHKSAEPGVLFWDTIKTSPADMYEEYQTEGTNPCGEITLSKLDSCRLMLHNLYSYVVNPFTEKAYLDFDLFEKNVYLSQRLMDDLVDLEIEKVDMIIDHIKHSNDPEQDKNAEVELWSTIKKVGVRGRRTGLGITGMGDMLAALGLRYGTTEATDFAAQVHKVMCEQSYASSIDMACERGSFEAFDYSVECENDFVKRAIKDLPESYQEKYKKFGRRNIANLTIAPAGSVSIMTQTTSGIEPCFLVSYKRRRRTDDPTKAAFTDKLGIMFEEFFVFHHHFKTWMKVNGYDCDKNYSDDEISEMISKSPYYKATSNDVDWVEKVKMQGRIQSFIDHSISVTVNMSKGTTEETVAKVYMTAWESGCKGCTVYIDGTLDGVLVSSNDNCNKPSALELHNAPKRPKILPCDIHMVRQKGDQYLCAVGMMDGKPYEVFVTKFSDKVKATKGYLSKVKSGTYSLLDEHKNVIIEDLGELMVDEIEDFTRMISFGLRHSGSIKFAVEQLQKSKGSMSSFSKVLARTLKKYIENGEKSSSKCPECGDSLRFSDGCLICASCGHSKCS